MAKSLGTVPKAAEKQPRTPRLLDFFLRILGVPASAGTTAISDTFGEIKERRSYDAFGQPRNGNFSNRATLNLDPPQNRGFTGHEHLDQTYLIHMNGRTYDYRLGRFLAVDPFIQFPTNSQSLNPYSYLLNNPLAGTDPTGFVASCSGENAKRRQACGPLALPDLGGGGVSFGGFSDTISLRSGLAAQSNGADRSQSAESTGRTGDKQPADEKASIATRGNKAADGDKGDVRFALQFSSDFLIGAGDTLSFGFTNYLRDKLDLPSPPADSEGYIAGGKGGVVIGLGTGGAALVKAGAGRAVAFGVRGASATEGAAVTSGAAQVAPRVANTANHIFGPQSLAKHKLGGVLDAFKGDSVGAFNALERAAQQLANQGSIKGVFQTSVEVAGQTVTVRGAVVEGVVRVGTAFIR